MRKLKVTELNRLTPEAFKNSEKIPLIVVLDHVRSLNNVGSVFRTSDAFRVESIYLCGITACPPHAEIHKTALGAEDSVDWKYFKDTLEAVENLKQQGYTVCAIEPIEEIGQNTVVCYSEGGYFLRFALDDVPLLKKSAKGVKALRLKAGDRLMGARIVKDDPVVEYKGKEIHLKQLKIGLRGSAGVKQRS